MISLSMQDLQSLQSTITKTISNPDLLQNKETQEVIIQCLRYLETGTLRVASPKGMGANCGEVEMNDLLNWEVHPWVKQSILLAMKMRTAETFRFELNGNILNSHQGRFHAGSLSYHDKFDVRSDLANEGVRSSADPQGCGEPYRDDS